MTYDTHIRLAEETRKKIADEAQTEQRYLNNMISVLLDEALLQREKKRKRRKKTQEKEQ